MRGRQGEGPFVKTKHRAPQGKRTRSSPRVLGFSPSWWEQGCPPPLHPHQQLEQEKGAVWSPPSSVPFRAAGETRRTVLCPEVQGKADFSSCSGKAQ